MITLRHVARVVGIVCLIEGILILAVQASYSYTVK